jgi:hypothetical protein
VKVGMDAPAGFTEVVRRPGEVVSSGELAGAGLRLAR